MLPGKHKEYLRELAYKLELVLSSLDKGLDGCFVDRSDYTFALLSILSGSIKFIPDTTPKDYSLQAIAKIVGILKQLTLL